MLKAAEQFLLDEKDYSYYIDHFKIWFDLYGKDKFLFIPDTTLHDPTIRQRLMDEISAFAGVPAFQYADDGYVEVCVRAPQTVFSLFFCTPVANSPLYDESLTHASVKKWTIPNSLRQVLWDIFELDARNAELYKVLGKDLGWTAQKVKK